MNSDIYTAGLLTFQQPMCSHIERRSGSVLSSAMNDLVQEAVIQVTFGSDTIVNLAMP